MYLRLFTFISDDWVPFGLVFIFWFIVFFKLFYKSEYKRFYTYKLDTETRSTQTHR